MAEEKKTNYDVVVIGAGPGGMTAAMYASRANLSVLMLDRGIYGGNLNNTAEIENYTGFKSVKGPDLAQQMYDGATQFGADYAPPNSIATTRQLVLHTRLEDPRIPLQQRHHSLNTYNN